MYGANVECSCLRHTVLIPILYGSILVEQPDPKKAIETVLLETEMLKLT